MLKSVFCFILCAFLLSGCNIDLSGINNVVDSVKPVKLAGSLKSDVLVSEDGLPVKKMDFENISFTNTEIAKIYIVPSEETRVEITYPSDIENHEFRAFIHEGEIKISVPKQTNFSAEKFEITVFANIEEVEIFGGIEIEMDAAASKKVDINVKGGAKAYIYNIDANDVEIDVSGAATLDLSGKAGEFGIDLKGAGTIDAKSLVCKIADVEISGAGAAEISVTERLFADIDGVGTLTYYGDPIVENISGGLTDVEQASKEIYGGI